MSAQKLLVVEDDALNQQLITEMLSILYPDVDVVVAEDGIEALEHLDTTSFAAILSDIGMPRMDGIELIRQVRQRLKLSVPAICLTAFTISGDRERFISCGYDEFVAKPIDFAELKAVLEKYL